MELILLNELKSITEPLGSVVVCRLCVFIPDPICSYWGLDEL